MLCVQHGGGHLKKKSNIMKGLGTRHQILVGNHSNVDIQTNGTIASYTAFINYTVQ